MAQALGTIRGYANALVLAEVHGVADGEDWKAKYEVKEATVDRFVVELEHQRKENQALYNQLQEAEKLLGALVPDVPEEGIDDAA